MSTSVITRGQDTFVQSASPNAKSGSYGAILLQSTTKRGLLYMALAAVKNKTVLSAVLSVKVGGNALASQTITVQALSSSWAESTATWNNQPGVTGATATKVTGAVAALGRFDIDVTTLVQNVANGQAHYGWRITTSSAATTNRIYGFDAGADSWTLTVETSDAPQAPTSLHPDGGVIATAKPTVSCDFTDLGGDTNQSSLQVRISPTQNTGTAWDSGEVATTIPVLDLSGTSYPGITSGSTYWQIRVKDGDGLWSAWSDWATWTYVAKPTLTVDNPSSGVLWDATTTIEAHVSAGTIKQYQVIVTADPDTTDVRYDSGHVTNNASSFAHELPLRNGDFHNRLPGDLVFPDNGTYKVTVRAWDRLDRQTGAAADPPYLTTTSAFTFNDDGAVTPPTAVGATQYTTDSPRVRVVWSRAANADGWTLFRDGVRIARLGGSYPDALDLGSNQYAYIDDGARINVSHTWTVRAVVNGRQSVPSADITATVHIDGVWLLTEHGDVVMEGEDVSGLRSADKRATYSPPGAAAAVDIITAFEGVSGSFSGTLDLREGRTSVSAVRTILKAIRDDATTPVRLMYAHRNVPVLLRNVSVDPSPNWNTDYEEHTVSFECWQVGEFGVKV